jgi:hypothetical protein
MEGVFTLGIYVAIGITGAAFAQAPPKCSPIPPSMMKAFATTNPLLEQLATQSAAKTAEIARQLAAVPSISAEPIMPITRPIGPPIVISFGRGGRVDEHRQQFANYQRSKRKVEVRGPCYSACTLVLAYVEPENLCIGNDAFMAFHAVRSKETGARMDWETALAYRSMPAAIKAWIDDNGGHDKLPLNDGYWMLRDRELWALPEVQVR